MENDDQEGFLPSVILRTPKIDDRMSAHTPEGAILIENVRSTGFPC